MTTNLKTKLLLTLALLMLLVPTELRAQQLQASLSHYSTEDGMPSNTIVALRTDDYGFLWLATWNGVSRFDGYHFYNYKTGVTSGVHGLHNRVENMAIDLSQNVWLKMYDGRVFVINRKTDCIEDPLEGINGHDDFHVDYFFNPYVTTTGDVLISYDDIGLYKLRLDQTRPDHNWTAASKQCSRRLSQRHLGSNRQRRASHQYCQHVVGTKRVLPE